MTLSTPSCHQQHELFSHRDRGLVRNLATKYTDHTMVHYRQLIPCDLDIICQHREAMFRDSGQLEGAIAKMAQPFRRWLAPKLDDGRYFGFLVELEKHAIASIGLTIIDWPPHPSHPGDDQRGYVLNLFVEPPFRGRGIARRLMEMSEETFINHGILHLVLHATTKGSEFYKAIGWSGTTEMSKTLDPATS